MTRTMYAPCVYERWEGGAPAIRTIVPTLEEAKAILNAERERVVAAPLVWVHEFGGAMASVGDLVYDVLPVEVAI